MSTIRPYGIYRDRLLSANGRLISDSGWKANMIVTTCRVLLGGLMGGVATARGIQTLQVGRGLPQWDVTPPPPPDPNTTTTLVDPAPFVIQQSALIIQYLDNSEAIVAGPTSRIQIVATLGLNQPSPAASPPFPLREFGLFGELNARPFMIDYIRHPLIEKSGSCLAGAACASRFLSASRVEGKPDAGLIRVRRRRKWVTFRKILKLWCRTTSVVGMLPFTLSKECLSSTAT